MSRNNPGVKSPKNPGRSLSLGWLLALVVLASALVYLNSVKGGFIYDDERLIVENPVIRSLWNIPQILGFTGAEPLQRPVRHLSYMIDYRFTGLNPIGYHLSNILFHVLTCLLVFFLALRLLGRERLFPAFVAALVFAVHPVHTDAVSYISGRRDILSTLFFLLGFILFIRYRTQGRLWFLLSAYLVYLLACFSKEMAITLPAVFLLYDWMTEEREGQNWKSFFLAPFRVLRKYWWQYLLFFITALLFAYYTVFILKVSNQKAYYGGSVFLNFLTVGKILAYYIYLLILPLKLSIIYSYQSFPITRSPGEISAWLAVIFILFLAAGSVWAMKKSSWAGFLGLWFFLTLLPVCHIIPHHDLLAEHYLYLPSFAFCLLLGMGLEKLYVDRKTRTLAYVFLALLVLAGSVRTVIRNQDWKDAVTMWKKTIEIFPKCAAAHLNLGVAYGKLDMFDPAVEELNRAYRMTPSNPMIQVNLAIAYRGKGMPAEAQERYQTAIALDPDLAEARIGLGILYREREMTLEAETQFKKLLEIHPRSSDAHINLGILYGDTGRLDEAIAELQQAIKLKPREAPAHFKLGIMYGKKGRWNEAVTEYQEALKYDPRDAYTHNNLGTAYALMGMMGPAIKEFEAVIRFSPETVETYYNLGLVCGKNQQRDRAVKILEKAIALDRDRHRAEIYTRIMEEMKSNPSYSGPDFPVYPENTTGAPAGTTGTQTGSPKPGGSLR